MLAFALPPAGLFFPVQYIYFKTIKEGLVSFLLFGRQSSSCLSGHILFHYLMEFTFPNKKWLYSSCYSLRARHLDFAVQKIGHLLHR